jgi:hypothetical protein
MFQNQQSAASRGVPLGASRLQNGKLGEDILYTSARKDEELIVEE